VAPGPAHTPAVRPHTENGGAFFSPLSRSMSHIRHRPTSKRVLPFSTFLHAGAEGANLFIDWVTCVVSSVAGPASVTPGHAADIGIAGKNDDWLEIVERQGDRFFGSAVEDGGRL